MTDISAKETTTEPAEKPVPRILSNGIPREKTYTLQWPVEYDGVTYDEITIRRCSGKDIDNWVAASMRGEDVSPPVLDIPVEVWHAMDADDQTALDEAALDFMPRRLKVVAGLGPKTGEESSPSSATPSTDGPLQKS